MLETERQSYGSHRDNKKLTGTSERGEERN
jgi:hypothetical protein